VNALSETNKCYCTVSPGERSHLEGFAHIGAGEAFVVVPGVSVDAGAEGGGLGAMPKRYWAKNVAMIA